MFSVSDDSLPSHGGVVPVKPETLIGYSMRHMITAVTNLISGLNQGTTYHYQIIASSAAGTVTGADKTFATLKVTPPILAGLGGPGSAVFQLSFTNATGASFSVLATNNLLAPRTNWPVVGHTVENPIGSGNYQYTNTAATNAQLFYLLRQP